MTQADLAHKLTLAWERNKHEYRIFDSTWIRKLESGEARTSITLELAWSIAEALSASKSETALLLHSAGYNGVALVLLEDLVDHVNAADFVVRIMACFPKLKQKAIPLDDVLHIVEMQMEAVRAEMSRKQGW